jgi:hypothetical protein
VDPFPEEHRGKRACAVIGCYNGPAERGVDVMAGLLDVLPAPLFNWMEITSPTPKTCRAPCR